MCITEKEVFVAGDRRRKKKDDADDEVESEWVSEKEKQNLDRNLNFRKFCYLALVNFWGKISSSSPTLVCIYPFLAKRRIWKFCCSYYCCYFAAAAALHTIAQSTRFLLFYYEKVGGREMKNIISVFF